MPTLKTEPARLFALAASLVLGAAVIGLLGGTLTSAHAAEPVSISASGAGFSAGIEVRPSARAEDIGLPVYPGATPQAERGDDSAAASVGLWGGSLGFQLALQKYASAASLDRVAAYYHDALGRYGTVLDCSQGRPASEPPPAEGAKKPLRCGKDDKADAGGRLYKVGTPNDQHIVSIKPAGSGVSFQLLHIATRS